MPRLAKLSIDINELTTGLLDRLPSLTKLKLVGQRYLPDAFVISHSTLRSLSLQDGPVPLSDKSLPLLALICGAARPFNALTRLSISTLVSSEMLDGLTQLRQLESLQFKRALFKLPQLEASPASLNEPVDPAEVERAGLVIENSLNALLASLDQLREFTWQCCFLPLKAWPTLRLKINHAQLRRLTLRTAYNELVELECPELRRLGIFSTQLHRSLSWSSVASSTPRLRRFWIGDTSGEMQTERSVKSVQSAIGGWHCLKQLLVRDRITFDDDDVHLALRCIPHLDLGVVQASRDHMAALVCELSRLVSLRLEIPSLSVGANALHNSCLTQLHLFNLTHQSGTLRLSGTLPALKAHPFIARTAECRSDVSSNECTLSGLPNLVELRLNGLPDIDEVVVVDLELLSIVEIENCGVLSVTVAGCPVLNSVGISQTLRLERMSLESPELERLRISHATKLRVIEPLDLPECAYVALRGACHTTVTALERILERCTRLRHLEVHQLSPSPLALLSLPLLADSTACRDRCCVDTLPAGDVYGRPRSCRAAGERERLTTAHRVVSWERAPRQDHRPPAQESIRTALLIMYALPRFTRSHTHTCTHTPPSSRLTAALWSCASVCARARLSLDPPFSGGRGRFIVLVV
jgi:hypothetical protein